MKRIPLVMISSLLVPVMVSGQTPATTPTAKNQTSLPANQESNIRAYTELLRTDLRKNKSQVVGQVMQLDAEQAKVFWPIYKDFESEVTQNVDQAVALVKKYAANYDTMTDEVADQLTRHLLDMEQQRVELRRKYYERLKTALDPFTAARFLQVENQIENVVDLQIDSELPVQGSER